MARPKKVEKTSISNNIFLNALDFVSEIAKDKGTPQQTNCVINNGYLVQSNGMTSMGYPVGDLPNVNPHTLNTLAALRLCNAETSMTVMESKLVVRSGKFSAQIECLPDMPTIQPGRAVVPLGPEFTEALEQVSPFSVEDAKKVVLASILTKGGCLCSSDSIVIIQAYHGCNLPEMVLPKSFVTAILNTGKPITQFGYSGNTCTIWFADNSWIKAQLYAEQWPDIDVILNKKFKAEPPPEDFYKALAAIQPFSKSGNVYFEDGCLRSHRSKDEGAEYNCAGIMKGPCFNIKELKRISKLIYTVDFYSHNCMYFYSEDNKTRGALMGIRG